MRTRQHGRHAPHSLRAAHPGPIMKQTDATVEWLGQPTIRAISTYAASEVAIQQDDKGTTASRRLGAMTHTMVVSEVIGRVCGKITGGVTGTVDMPNMRLVFAGAVVMDVGILDTCHVS